MSDIFKFGWLPDGQTDVRYEHANVWVRQTTDKLDRLEIGPKSGHIALLERLASCLDEPFWLLYVLVLPRGGSEEGRYRSEHVFSFLQLKGFLSEYAQYLENDGRHNLWIQSVSGSGLLVYDRHNIIYAYGSIDQYIEVLTAAGLCQSNDRFLQYTSQHSHHYHPEFDSDERRIVGERQWEISPLQSGDENPD